MRVLSYIAVLIVGVLIGVGAVVTVTHWPSGEPSAASVRTAVANYARTDYSRTNCKRRHDARNVWDCTAGLMLIGGRPRYVATVVDGDIRVAAHRSAAPW